ncbi:MAG: hypothetical protein RBU45_08385 [Myxococcota bacterium]|jgi:hypothetical protein|nr:hypothetical protein [Myxococcota bacterium]
MNSNDRPLHCWQDRLDWVWQKGAKLGSPEYLDAIEHPATCMLPAGHEGPHEWMPDEEIVIEVPLLDHERESDEPVIVVAGGEPDAG